MTPKIVSKRTKKVIDIVDDNSDIVIKPKRTKKVVNPKIDIIIKNIISDNISESNSDISIKPKRAIK